MEEHPTVLDPLAVHDQVNGQDDCHHEGQDSEEDRPSCRLSQRPPVVNQEHDASYHEQHDGEHERHPHHNFGKAVNQDHPNKAKADSNADCDKQELYTGEVVSVFAKAGLIHQLLPCILVRWHAVSALISTAGVGWVVAKIAGPIPALGLNSGLRAVFNAVAAGEGIGQILEKEKGSFVALGIHIEHAGVRLGVDWKIGLVEVGAVEEHAGEYEHDEAEDDAEAAAADVSDATVLI